jgi:hypothetical protein
VPTALWSTQVEISCQVEPVTTLCTYRDCVEFTAQVYADTFKRLARQARPAVLYPVVKHVPLSEIPPQPVQLTPYCKGYDTVFLSLNRYVPDVGLSDAGSSNLFGLFSRYERKKNIALAISALQHFKTLQRKAAGDVKERKVLLVVAGGYDVRVTENVEYLKVASIWRGCGPFLRLMGRSRAIRS